MSDISYQNQDLGEMNPLMVDAEEETASQESKPKSSKFTLPDDPKTKLLIILIGVVIFLFVISIPITIFRNIQLISKRPVTKPTPALTPRPTEVTDISKIPEELRVKFEKVDKEIQTNINFPPPQIDTEIGF